MISVAINGLGRIGRALFKVILDTPELELAAVNDLMTPDQLAYLLKYDTVYGKLPKTITIDDNDNLNVDGKSYPTFNNKEPDNLPWDELAVDTVFECTGEFSQKEGLQKHIQAGAKRAILSAPANGPDIGTIIPGVNHPRPKSPQLISCGSCTTNCITPLMEVMGRRIGVQKAISTTIHAYTAGQQLVDSGHSNYRRGRAAANNLVPTSTGAATVTTQVLPHYKGLFDGTAVRVPVPVGSMADVTCLTERKTSVAEVNNIFKEEAQSQKYSDILGVSEEPIVSADIIKDPRASIVDLSMTQVVDGNLVKIMSWYDNEWGYANQLVRAAIQMGQSLDTPEPIAEREIDDQVMVNW